MISMTRREFDALSETLTQTWIEAQWATLRRRARRQALLPASERDAAEASLRIARRASPAPSTAMH